MAKKTQKRTRVSYAEKNLIREKFETMMRLAEQDVVRDIMKDTGRSLSTVRRAVYRTLG